MAEYIDREAISEEIRKYYYKNPPNFSYGEGFDRGLDRAQRAILDAPAADVVPVVRCKDCRYRGLICCPAIHETIGNGLVDYAVDNGYCWCGKSKET